MTENELKRYEFYPSYMESDFNKIYDDSFLKYIYINFDFHFYDLSNAPNNKIIFDHLLKYKFAIYKLWKDPHSNTNNVYFCTAKKVLNFISIDENYVNQTIENSSNITFFNADDSSMNDIKSSFNDDLKIIKNNVIFDTTFDLILVFLVKRFFMPTEIFENKVFFEIDPQIEFKEEHLIKLTVLKTSSIYLVFHKQTLQLFVLKTIENPNNDRVKNEIEFVQNYSHSCLTPFYGFVKKGIIITGFMYKFMSNGSLLKFIKNPESDSSLFKLTTMNRISQGIQYLHSNYIIFPDLQPSNILIDNDLNAYINDFGDVHIKHSPNKHYYNNDVGSSLYISPEQAKGEFSFEADIYSFGKLMFFLYEKKDLNAMPHDFSKKAIKMKNANETINKLCEQCLQEPEKRPTIDEIQSIISQEANRPFENVFFFNNTMLSVIQYCIESKLLGSKTLHNFNMKYVWLYFLFKFLSGVDQSNCYLYMGYYYYYGSDYLLDKESHKVKDIHKAISCFEKAGSDNPKALLFLGNIYHYDMHISRDYLKALYYYERASNLGNIEALFELGNLYNEDNYNNKNFLQSLHYYEQAAKENHPKSNYLLGKFYFTGNGVEKDINKSMHYFLKAAVLKESDALFELGNIYYYGIGVDKNYIKAGTYYYMANKQNNFNAALVLGDIYSNGKGVDINIAESIKYYLLSIQYINEITINHLNNKYSLMAYSIACNNLGLSYLLEPECRNYEKAVFYIQESALSFYPFGKNNYGLLCEMFSDKESEKERAINFYKKASEKDFVLASFNLGRIYENKKEIEKAIEYFMIASDNEDKPLMFQNEIIYDESYENSKTFIICLTNLKLCKHFLSKSCNDREKGKKYFIRSFSKLIIQNKLHFTYKGEKDYKRVYSYIKNYILYHSLNPSKHDQSNEIDNTNCFQNKKYFLPLLIYGIIDESINNYRMSNYDEKIQIKNSKLNDEILVNSEFFNEKIISNPDDLFELAFTNFDLFMRNITEIIHYMTVSLFTYPFYILFGRMKNKTKKTLPHEINHLFYEGIGNIL